MDKNGNIIINTILMYDSSIKVFKVIFYFNISFFMIYYEYKIIFNIGLYSLNL